MQESLESHPSLDKTISAAQYTTTVNNYHGNGAQVTMLQRSGTYIISAKTGLSMLHEGPL